MTRIHRKTAALCIAVGTIAFLIGWFSFLLISKHWTSNRDAFLILDSMSDFTYVGSGVFSNELSVPAHDMNRQRLPTKLQAGHVYIFHYNRVDNGRLVQELTERLKTRGVRVFDVVTHGTGSYVGGSSFKISFQQGGYRGFISTALDNRIVTDEKITKPLSNNDYIVVLQEVGP